MQNQRPDLSKRILVLDDEPDMLDNCRRILNSAGYECFTTTDPVQALAMLNSENPDVLVTDLKMPGLDGMDMLKQSRESDPLRPVIIFTAFASIESAIVAIRQGAFDYLPKPFSNEQLKVTVERALQQRRLALENLHLREQIQGTYGFENIIGRSHALQQTLELVRKAAKSEANVLIVGESGTGKELVARAIHANSRRSSEALVPVDCASLPENLLESELFGYEHGAFTGATKSKPGLIEVANRGTLFLDEIGELIPELQAKLLRVVQERQFRRIGGTRQIEVDLRLVCATNRDLEELIAQQKFREDLYYRLNVICARIPPLRDRRGDIPLLANFFLNRYREQNRKPELRGFSPDVIASMESHKWPGNIRELQNVIERACALADGDTITLKDLPEQFTTGNSVSADLRTASLSTLTYREAKERWLAEFESAYAEDLLQKYGGNLSRAADAAQVDRKTFRKLLNKDKR